MKLGRKLKEAGGNRSQRRETRRALEAAQPPRKATSPGRTGIKVVRKAMGCQAFNPKKPSMSSERGKPKTPPAPHYLAFLAGGKTIQR